MSNKEKLHLFIYHQNDPVTIQNYDQLCKIEGFENVQPISECQSYLPKTFRLDNHPWPFPHPDGESRWMSDGLVYKYILFNKNLVMSYSNIIINEWDTWWQTSSDEWLPSLMKNYDIVGSDKLVFNKHKWEWFDRNKNSVLSSKMCGLAPLTVICVKSKIGLLISEMVRDDSRFHNLWNSELRMATAANVLGAKIGELPHHIKKNVKFRGTIYSSEPGTYHPIKHIIPQEVKEKALRNAPKYTNETKIKKNNILTKRETSNKIRLPKVHSLNIIKINNKSNKYNNITKRR